MIELESMAVEMPEVKGHPNRVAFRGVLTVVDVPSTNAPHGSHGKRVLLTRRAAEKALPSLLGMAVDYSPSLDQHDQQRKVGVITSADVVGHELQVSGYLYAKDFPMIVDEISKASGHGHQVLASQSRVVASKLSLGTRTFKTGEKISYRPTEGARLRNCLSVAVQEIRAVLSGDRAEPSVLRAEATSRTRAFGAGRSKRGLGMSFEVTNVNVLNRKARIWRLIDVTFTGAAILRKDKAAYPETWIELSSS